MTPPAGSSPLYRNSPWTCHLWVNNKKTEAELASFWFRKKEGIPRTPQGWLDFLRSPDRVRSSGLTLKPTEIEILGILKRYGGTVTYQLLLQELLARGLLDPWLRERSYRSFGFDNSEMSSFKSSGDYEAAISRLLRFNVLSVSETIYRNDLNSIRHGKQRFELTCHPTVLESVPVAVPKWATPYTSTVLAPFSGGSTGTLEGCYIDLRIVLRELREYGSWEVDFYGMPPKPFLTKLRKALAASGTPTGVAAPEGLLYALLRGMKIIEFTPETSQAWISSERDLWFSQLNREDFLLALVQAWMWQEDWRDGLGIIPKSERNRSAEYGGTAKFACMMRETLVLFLTELAGNPTGWFDLRDWLLRIRTTLGSNTPNYSYETWQQRFPFKPPANTGDSPRLRSQDLPYWLDTSGNFFANMLFGTLRYFGLVETSGDPLTETPCFRLTATGRSLLGRPESPLTEEPEPQKFLTLQSNYEIHARLDLAPLPAVAELALFARRKAGSTAAMQTFMIEQESVYRALEEGFSHPRILEFLNRYNSSVLPPNVAQGLLDWNCKRESLTIRRGLTLQILVKPPKDAVRDLGRGLYLALPGKKRRGPVFPGWVADESGKVTLQGEPNLVVLARLRQIATEESPGNFRLTRESMQRAFRRGRPPETIVQRLQQHHVGSVPVLLGMMIRNWATSAAADLREQLVLRIPAEDIKILQKTKRFAPWIIGSIEPNGLVLDGSKKQEIQAFLEEIGYVTQE